MPESGKRAAPLRGLALQIYTVFTHPIFQGLALLICAWLFYYNHTALKPLYALRAKAEQDSNNLLVEKNQLLKLMPPLRLEDLDRQMEALRKRVVMNDNQANAEAKKIARVIEDCEWSGEVVPAPPQQTFPTIPFLRHYPLLVKLTVLPAQSSRLEDKEQTRLFRLLREVERTRRLHFLRRLDVRADKVRGWQVELEYDFYTLQEAPRG